MKKYLVMLFVAILTLLSITACSSGKVEATVVAEVTPQAAAIAEGRLLPVNWLDQAFTIPGTVETVVVGDGDVVAAGDPLATLAHTADVDLALARARQEILSAQQALDGLNASANLNKAQAELAVLTAQEALENAQDNFDANATQENQFKLDAATAGLTLAQSALARITEGNGVDADMLATAQSRLEVAQAGLANAEEMTAAYQLTASLDGTVVDLALQPGQMVASGAPVMVVADLSQWVVKTDNMSEMQVSDLEVGQKVEVVLDALPDLTLTGEITHIASRYEEKRGDITFTVTVLLDKADPRMRWGMTAAVNFK